MPRIAIIGAGFGGLAMGIRCKQEGIGTFTIFEKADRIGGTWRANTYPGAECDIPSALYSYSFAPSAEWPNKWSHQPVILEYLEKCVADHQLADHIRLNTGVVDACFDEREKVWRLATDDGATHEFDVLVAATGQLSRPRWPSIEGLDTFAGTVFHSAEWDHDHDLGDERVAVVGNAASATQFIPEIAPAVAHLTIFQRSANWMVPKNDRDYREWEKKVLRRFPSLSKIRRFQIWARAEWLIWSLMGKESRVREKAETATLDYMHSVISDPDWQAALTPDYPMGARRILFSDTYYPGLEANRDHLDIVTSPIERVAAGAVVTADGVEHPVDTIICATGFHTHDFLTPMRVVGLDGRVRNDEGETAPEAYLGMAVSGFPNLFFLYGPNTNLGHNSIVVMIEAQVRYILSCLGQMAERGVRAIDVRPEVQAEFNDELDRRLADSAWAMVSDSWYVQDGKVTNNWAGRTTEYGRRTRHCDLDEYVIVG